MNQDLVLIGKISCNGPESGINVRYRVQNCTNVLTTDNKPLSEVMNCADFGVLSYRPHVSRDAWLPDADRCDWRRQSHERSHIAAFHRKRAADRQVRARFFPVAAAYWRTI
jgi:hypothetical protein